MCRGGCKIWRATGQRCICYAGRHGRMARGCWCRTSSAPATAPIFRTEHNPMYAKRHAKFQSERTRKENASTFEVLNWVNLPVCQHTSVAPPRISSRRSRSPKHRFRHISRCLFERTRSRARAGSRSRATRRRPPMYLPSRCPPPRPPPRPSDRPQTGSGHPEAPFNQTPTRQRTPKPSRSAANRPTPKDESICWAPS